ncbi:MAG: alpha/beta hydrolase [Oscillospiraceae bacterium]|nr:alpha/beta hydrolase [Oscillospiraceae bacterium]
MADCKLDTSWVLIEPDDPVMGSDMVDISKITRKWLDVPYSDVSPSQVLDIYLPEEGEGPFPTYIFIHGGAFFAGDKQDVQFLLAVEGVNRGYAVVSIEYRKAFESKAPNALYDVKSAIRFLRKNAAKYNLDPEKFALGGDSAGAYYAVFAAATSKIKAFDGPSPVLSEVSGDVQAVVAQCGCYDLLCLTPPPDVEEALLNSPEPPVIPPNLMTIFVGVNLHKIPDVAVLLNPLTYITEDFPPTLVQVGRNDSIVPCTESENLAEKLKSCGVQVLFELNDGWDHCALNHILTPDWFRQANYDRVFGFLDEVL